MKKTTSIAIVSLLAASMICTCAYAETADTEEAAEIAATEEAAATETITLSGTFISNIDALEADEDFQQQEADGSLDIVTMENAISGNYYTEAYYFDSEGNMIHYTADEGPVTGSYTVENNEIKLDTANNSVDYPISISDDEIIISKGGQDVVFTKVLETSPVSMTMDDCSEIDVDSSLVEVTDDEIETVVSSIIDNMTTTETVTEGTAEDGDTVTISYEGVLEGETEPFDGGSSDETSLTLGSGTMIDGFEEAIVGNEIGSTFDINVTFPEDYSDENVAGKNAVFTITLISKNVENVPELTDEFVQEYSESNMTTQLNTVDELKQYIYDSLYDEKLESAISDVVTEKAHILAYDPILEEEMMNYSADGLEYYASMYGIDADTYANYCGYEDAAAYEKDEASYYLDRYMIAEAILTAEGIEITDEEIDADIEQYMDDYGYTDYYTLDEFKEASGDTWVWLYGNAQYKYEKAIDALKDNVVFVEAAEEDAATEEAAEDAAE